MPENSPAEGPKRDAFGHFLPGQTGNPGGRPKALAEVQRLAAEKGPRALQTLAEIADDTGAPPAARVAACTAILDRWVGKPTQPLTGDSEGDGKGAITVIIQEARKP